MLPCSVRRSGEGTEAYTSARRSSFANSNPCPVSRRMRSEASCTSPLRVCPRLRSASAYMLRSFNRGPRMAAKSSTVLAAGSSARTRPERM